MKVPTRLRIEPKPSRIGAIALAMGVVATALLMYFSMPDAWLCASTVTLVGVLGVSGVRRLFRPPLLIHMGADRSISVTTRDGRTVDGTIHDNTSVGAWLSAIVWVPDGARWYMPARTIIVLPDSMSREDFRRLRVYLRYRRAPREPDTSGVAAR